MRSQTDTGEPRTQLERSPKLLITTPPYASILAFLFTGLSANTIRTRQRFRVAMGNRDEIGLRQIARAQQNSVEYTPFFLVLALLAKFAGYKHALLHIRGVVCTLGPIGILAVTLLLQSMLVLPEK